MPTLNSFSPLPHALQKSRDAGVSPARDPLVFRGTGFQPVHFPWESAKSIGSKLYNHLFKHLLITTCLLTGCASTPQATHLQCQRTTNPLSIDSQHPLLSWQMSTPISNSSQSAYQIQASSTSAGPPDLWDTGRIPSDQSLNIPYAGKSLVPSQPCYWRVRIWDNQNRPSSWSSPALWESAPKWSAQWIRPAANEPGPLLRKTFHLPQPIQSARIYICGLGYYELRLNGSKVGDHLLDPAQTDYEQRALYVTYDVTPLLKSGDNTLGIMLGTGWFDQRLVWGGMSYGQPCALCQLLIQYVDGSSQLITTDNSWRSHAGPITRDNVYAGETYDARLELPGWDTPNFDDAGWKPVAEIPSPTARLEPQLIPPVRIARTITPISKKLLKPNLTIYDLGENFAGLARIQLSAPPGTPVQLRFAETIHPDGTLDTASTGVFATNVEQIDTYICKAPPPSLLATRNSQLATSQSYQPRFTYHGFRYVEVTGPPLEKLEGLVLHTDLSQTGSFTCSDPTLNTIHAMALRTELSNLFGTPTDCPARERCGWLGDAHATAELTDCNFDMSTFWPKYLNDIETSRHGQLPGDVAPGKRITPPNGNPDWGVALIMLPYYQYLYYDDTATLRQHYPGMRQFLLAFHSIAKDGIVSKGYGDWCPPGSVQPTETPVSLTSTAWLYRAATAMSLLASPAGHPQDAAQYHQIATTTAAAFNQHFYNPTTHSYGSQTADALALAWNLVPTKSPRLAAPLAGRVSPTPESQLIANDLAHDVIDRHHSHLATGIFGSRYLYYALSNYNHPDLTMTLFHQTTYPSLGYLISKGATTFWECYGEPELDQKWGARSLNHPMQAGFDAWFYRGVLGINPDPAKPGFKHIILKPQLTIELTSASGHLTSPYGPIISNWHTDHHTFTWHLEIPPNTTATAYPPHSAPMELTSGSHDLIFAQPQ